MQKDCGYWQIRSDYSIPALEEFSVCVNIKRMIGNSDWTAFMYLNPDRMQVELGLQGKGSELQTVMFGCVWSAQSNVTLYNWHSICITWSMFMSEPKVYVNGTIVALKLASKGLPMYPYCCRLAANGSLTLGVAHNFVKDKMIIETGTELKGSLSLFRVWGRTRTAEEISAMACTDGDILHWESRIWKQDQHCDPKQDSYLQCGKAHKFTQTTVA